MLYMESINKQIKNEDVLKIASNLGARIRVARVRRKVRQEDLAVRTGLSRSTIQSIERGETTCSVGAVINVLWTLGLAKELELIADPGLDRDGLSLSIDVAKKRVFIPRKLSNDF